MSASAETLRARIARTVLLGIALALALAAIFLGTAGMSAYLSAARQPADAQPQLCQHDPACWSWAPGLAPSIPVAPIP